MAYPDDTFELDLAARILLIHGLRVFATYRDDDAAQATASGMTGSAKERMREAAEARGIADRLEEATHLRVGRARPE